MNFLGSIWLVGDASMESRHRSLKFDSFIPSSNAQSPLMYFILNSLEVVIGREADGADTLSR